MFHIVLYQPEIPPNTGNVMRLCANGGFRLHLVKPLGFEITDKHLARAGMDYRDLVNVTMHEDWSALSATLALQPDDPRLYALSTRGRTAHTAPRYRAGDIFLFGQETAGLPGALLDTVPVAQRLRIPMQPDSRSLNLSNSVAIVAYEAWRQCDFTGATTP
ncbi:tRNA (cytidine(34)-2'-O)-methyltransferase [Methyloversatilis sp. XJ19-49]|uniref:tRNA (cytidine(34)-2'-O)-methyltransferase n=1 Tax=Methyloversatilis sp. XJ19-49 TaxID=2963429 RepID=UPI00211CCBAC|nr:tRNA (cytidine(34)-2'-O)-methyltransferase [Methyloversatilis sp. XJ19-49]MCQ9379607.1 tRNA (cytidine(34)-2'-O)-methyltransferase [Methyloversatilis sp. XJ19-49]